MTPTALFKRIMRNSNLVTRYKNPQILPIVARTILDEVLKLVAGSPIVGVYQPDPEKDGVDPLPKVIARYMDAPGAEDLISEQLAILARLDFLVITNANCIIVNLTTVLNQGSEPPKSTAARANGSKGGRPRVGETQEAYRERKAREAANQGSLMLPLAGGQGPVPYGDPLHGENLAQKLRSTFEVAPSEPETLNLVGFQTETQDETHQLTRQPAFGSVLGSVGFPEPHGEEEEDSDKEVLKEEDSVESSSSSSARVGEPETQTETENLKAAARNPTLKTQMLQTTSISPAAGALAKRGTARWQWSAADSRIAPRIFQDHLDEGWSIEQIERAIDDPTKPARTPNLYRKVLVQLYGGPGRAPALAPTVRADTRNYPPDLEGEWAERITRIRSRLRQSLGDVVYRSWLENVRIIELKDGELRIWAETPWRATHVKTELGDRMLGIIKAIVPDVLRLAFISSPSASQAKAG